jgi:DNA-3-methyladenine glycosylase
MEEWKVGGLVTNTSPTFHPSKPLMTILKRDFFSRPTITVARALLGQRLVRVVDGRRLSGLIVEAEAYIGPGDTASHASRGRTARTEAMFGPPGYAYIYLIYGMYYMLNLVTEAQDFPAAILIRAMEPQEGLDLIQANRRPRLATAPQLRLKQLTNGPGKVCQALAIDKSLHNWDVTIGDQLWLELASDTPEAQIAAGPRIGIDYAQPTDRAALWRFWVRDNPFVSK